jgi:hypothetical protein
MGQKPHDRKMAVAGIPAFLCRDDINIGGCLVMK